MINFETFLLGVLVTSTFTGLGTEAIKKLLIEHNKTYHANTLAGVVAVVLSAAIGGGYGILTGLEFSAPTIIYLVALIFISWLCAMVGYDKVVQTITQIKMDGKDETNE